MNLFDAERPRRVDIAADQEDVSSVVVLNIHKFSPLVNPSVCFFVHFVPRRRVCYYCFII